MVVKTRSLDASDREKWDKIFKGLVKIIRTKQNELESLVNARKILEDRIKTQHDLWVSDVRMYEDQLSMMKNEIETMEMMRAVEVAKSNLLVGLKTREASVSKFQLEHAMEDLEDFKKLVDLLTNENCNSKAGSDKSSEVKLKQFKRLESEFTGKLKEKDEEIAKANKKISTLISHKEQLQSSDHEKDEIIRELKAKVAEIEEDTSKKEGEISRLSKEIDLLKNAQSSKFTPALTRCMARKNSSNGKANKSNIATERKRYDSAVPALRRSARQGSKGGKRERDLSDSHETQKNTLSSKTPKLFNSGFKVPKLKASSPAVIQLS